MPGRGLRFPVCFCVSQAVKSVFPVIWRVLAVFFLNTSCTLYSEERFGKRKVGPFTIWTSSLSKLKNDETESAKAENVKAESGPAESDQGSGVIPPVSGVVSPDSDGALKQTPWIQAHLTEEIT